MKNNVNTNKEFKTGTRTSAIEKYLITKHMLNNEIKTLGIEGSLRNAIVRKEIAATKKDLYQAIKEIKTLKEIRREVNKAKKEALKEFEIYKNDYLYSYDKEEEQKALHYMRWLACDYEGLSIKEYQDYDLVTEFYINKGDNTLRRHKQALKHLIAHIVNKECGTLINEMIVAVEEKKQEQEQKLRLELLEDSYSIPF